MELRSAPARTQKKKKNTSFISTAEGKDFSIFRPLTLDLLSVHALAYFVTSYLPHLMSFHCFLLFLPFYIILIAFLLPHIYFSLLALLSLIIAWHAYNSASNCDVRCYYYNIVITWGLVVVRIFVLFFCIIILQVVPFLLIICTLFQHIFSCNSFLILFLNTTFIATHIFRGYNMRNY